MEEEYEKLIKDFQEGKVNFYTLIDSVILFFLHYEEKLCWTFLKSTQRAFRDEF